MIIKERNIRFAKLISLVLHPVFMPSLGLLVVFNTSVYFNTILIWQVKSIMLISVFVLTCLFPILNVVFLYKKEMVRSVYLETKEERNLPYLFTVIFYILLYYLLKQLQLPPLFYLLILGSTLAAVLALIINLKWKISAHMIGIGGVIGAVIGIAERYSENLNITLMILILCAGVLGYSRLKLKAHVPAQVYTGFITGLLSILLLVLATPA